MKGLGWCLLLMLTAFAVAFLAAELYPFMVLCDLLKCQ